MSDSGDDKPQTEAPEEPKEKRKGGLRRFLQWVALIALLLFVVLAIVGVVAWNNRTVLVTKLSRKLPIPVEMEVDQIRTENAARKIILEGVRIYHKDPDADPDAVVSLERAPFLEADSAEWSPDFTGIAGGSLGTLQLKNPRLEWDLAPSKTEANADARANPKDKGSSPLHWDQLEIEGGNFLLRDEEGSLLAVEGIHWSGEDLHWKDGTLRSEAQNLRVDHLDLGGHAVTDDLELTFSIGEDGILQLPVVSAGETQIKVDAPFLERLARLKGVPTQEPSTTEEPPSPPLFTGFQIGEGILGETHLTWDDLSEHIELPPALKHGRVVLDSTNLSGFGFNSQEGWLGEPRMVAVRDLGLGATAEFQDFQTPKAQALVQIQGGTSEQPTQRVVWSYVVIEQPVLHLLPAHWELSGTMDTEATSDTENPPTGPSMEWVLQSGRIDSGQFTMDADPEAGIPAVEAQLSTDLAGWSSNGDWPDQTQNAVFEMISIQSDASTPDTSMAYSFEGSEVEVAISPADLVSNRVIEKLKASSLDLSYRGPAVSETEGDDPAPVSDNPETDTTLPFWDGLTVGEASIAKGHADLSQLGATVPNIKGDFSVQGGGRNLKLGLANLDLTLPGSKDPFYHASKVTLQTDPEVLWETGRLGEISIEGGNLVVDKDLQALTGSSDEGEDGDGTEPDPNQPPAPKTTPTSGGRNWSLDKVAIGGTRIYVDQISPLVPNLDFQLETTLEDVPLDLSKFEGEGRSEKIQLTGLVIPSPYGNPYDTVADLGKISLEFTTGGLFRKEIDRLEIAGPQLNIGKPLFWYIDYYRRFGPGGSEAPPKETTNSGWEIGEIEVIDGRLRSAPDQPLPFLSGLVQPFPFSTKVQGDDIAVTLDISPDTYSLPKIPLTLEGLRGNVKFNLPFPKEDNNLVEVLNATKIIFKQFESTETWASVTYDERGIYGTFGGEFYGGYVNGGFNIYLDETSNWDAWVSATGVDADRFTKLITPEYFRMTGKFDLNIVANGDKDQLHEATGDFTTTTDGIIEIVALDEFAERLPEDWEPLRLALLKAGLQTIRNFEYDTGKGEFVLYGREGSLNFRLAGPSGSRNFEVRVHDHRSR